MDAFYCLDENDNELIDFEKLHDFNEFETTEIIPEIKDLESDDEEVLEKAPPISITFVNEDEIGKVTVDDSLTTLLPCKSSCPSFTCSLCGKPYKSKFYYEKHISKCKSELIQLKGKQLKLLF